MLEGENKNFFSPQGTAEVPKNKIGVISYIKPKPFSRESMTGLCSFVFM